MEFEEIGINTVQYLEQKYEHLIETRDDCDRALLIERGCIGLWGKRTCGEPIYSVIIFDVKPNSETPKGEKNYAVPTCAHHSLEESDEFEWIRTDPSIENIRTISLLDYIDGKF